MGGAGCVGGVTKMEAKRISEKPFLDSYSLEMPEKEMSYSLIGQGFLEEETGQRIIEVLLILEHLEEQVWKEGERGEVQGGGSDESPQTARRPPATAYALAKDGIFKMQEGRGGTDLHQLNEVLGQLVISQVLFQAAHSKVPDHGIRVVTVQQLHGLLGTNRRPFFQEAIHLRKRY